MATLRTPTAFVISCVAMLLGTAALLTATGWHTNTALVIGALSPIATFTAAYVALWVATSGRRELKEERDDADRKQAGLVRLKATWSELGTPRASVSVSVRNFGKLPIVDVAVTGWKLDGNDITIFSRTDPKEAVMPYTGITDPAEAFAIRPATTATRIAMEGEPYPSNVTVAGNPLKTPPSVSNLTDVTVTIEFTDAGEERWRRSNKGLVERA